MVSLFKSNKPHIPLILLGYAVLLQLPMFLFPRKYVVPEAQEPLSNLLLSLIDKPHIVAAIFSVLLVVIQALVVNKMITDLRLFDKANYVPALMYVVVSSLFTEFLYPGPQLLANLFVVLVLMSIMRLYKSQENFSEIFDVGFMIAIASLFYSPTMVLLVLMFIGLGILRAFAWREWVTGLAGFLAPYILISTYYFLVDGLGEFWYEQFSGMFNFGDMHLSTGLDVKVTGSFVVLLLMLSAWYLQASYLKSQIQIRKFLVLVVWTLILLFFSFVLDDDLSLKHFVIITVPLSVILSYYMLNFKKQRWPEIIHWLLVLSILFFQYYPEI